MKLRSTKGFSLVELIIVIAILGIIAVIAVPSLTSIQQRSQVNADIRTAEQIGKAIRIYLSDSAASPTALTDWTDYSTITNISSYIANSYVPKSFGTGGKYFVKVETEADTNISRVYVYIGSAAHGSGDITAYSTPGTAGLAYGEAYSSLGDAVTGYNS